MRNIGLMGGTFDPIHYGHLFLAEAARGACDLDEVIFFPNNQPAHAQGKNASLEGELRYELMCLGIASNPRFRGSRIELERPGKSFAFDTIRQFQAELGEEAELFFIVGADSMRDIKTWYRGSELFGLCRFIAGTRPGFDLDTARDSLEEWQRERVVWLELPGLHIASSDLRRRVAAGEPIRYLVPDVVSARIEMLNLYRGGELVAGS